MNARTSPLPLSPDRRRSQGNAAIRFRFAQWAVVLLLSLWSVLGFAQSGTIGIAPATPPASYIYSPYQLQFTASGGTAPYTFRPISLSAGSLSAGGLFTATPTIGNEMTVSFDIVDGGGQTSPVFTMRIPVLVAPITVLNVTPPAATVGVPYTHDLDASGGVAPYRFSLLYQPAWLSIGNDGRLTGTPPAGERYVSFTVEVRDSLSAAPGSGVIGPVVRRESLVLNVSDDSLHGIDPDILPDGALGAPYTLQLEGRGASAAINFATVQGVLPPGVSLGATGAITGTPTQAGSHPFTVRARFADGADAFRTYTLRVLSAGFEISPSSMPVGMAGVRYRQPITGVGGSAPYAVGLSGALPAGLGFDPATGIDGIPLQSGSFDITLSVTDATSTTITRNDRIVIQPPALTLYTSIPEATLATPYQFAIGHNGGLGPFRHVVSAGSLPPGMSLGEADGVLSGTPGAAGQYPFSITLTDSTQGTPGTTTEAYVLIVNDPAVQVVPAILPRMPHRVPYSVTLSLDGASGAAQFSLVSGALPPGLTLSGSGVISGTPTHVSTGPIDFTVEGRLPGGAFARRSYRVDVDPAVILQGQLPVATAGAPYSQTLQISGAASSYQVQFRVRGGSSGIELVPGLTLPAGLSITPAPDAGFRIATPGTFTISGTPRTTGDFVLTMELLVDGATRTVFESRMLRVVPGTLVVPATVLPRAGIGQPYRHVLQAQGGVAPYRFSLPPDATLPAGLRLGADGVVSGTPTERGNWTVSVVVADATQPAASTITAALSIEVGDPVVDAPSRTIGMVAGSIAMVDLTEGASGGPFTGATVVSLSPADAGMATIAASGTGASARHVLTFVPAKTFSGRATVRYTLSNGAVTSNEATIVFDVAPRPDPSADAEVRGLIDAQALSARRFADAQMGNFQQRLERLHRGGEGARGFENAIGVAATHECRTPVGGIPGQRCLAMANGAEADGSSAASGNDARFGTWAAGVLRSGDRDAANGRAALDFETEGVSIGVDTRLGRFIVGGGVGYGHDRTWIGHDDGRVDARAFTFAAYGGRTLGERGFIDGLLGYQRLDYDLRRTVTANGATVRGRRDGHQRFASLTAGANLGRDRWGVTPYGRAEYTRGSLDAYTETGDPLHALDYDAQSLRALTVDLGLRLDYRAQTAFGMVSPQLRIEYQHDLQRSGDATLRYADWLDGPVYRVRPQGYSRDRFELGLGVQFEFGQAWQLGIGHRLLIGDDGDRDHGTQLNLDMRF
jgi:uncharacterized protein YhjY with autotransporter beta-barrel domain